MTLTRRNALALVGAAALAPLRLVGDAALAPIRAVTWTPGTRRPTRVAPAALSGTRVTLSSGRTYVLSGAATSGLLMLGIHGSNLTADNANSVFWNQPGGWQTHAAANGYGLALLEGLPGRSWNLGHGWTSGDQDDVGYALEVVDDASARLATVSTTVPVGFSAGGALAWLLTCRYPARFYACGVASGWAVEYPTSPINCFHTHGTDDTTVPIRGGFVPTFDYTFPAQYLECAWSPRGSRVVPYVTKGGHAVPGWFADVMLGATRDVFPRP